MNPLIQKERDLSQALSTLTNLSMAAILDSEYAYRRIMNAANYLRDQHRHVSEEMYHYFTEEVVA